MQLLTATVKDARLTDAYNHRSLHYRCWITIYCKRSRRAPKYHGRKEHSNFNFAQKVSPWLRRATSRQCTTC
jgi:hypothetical protein